MRKSILDRFNKKYTVDASGCWLWTAFRNNVGYGQINAGRRGEGMLKAHRVSFELHVGPIPEGLWVLHRCDVRHCVNPEHLFLGTAADNMRDMCEKGRHGRTKLTEADVRAIRADTRAQRTIAAAYGIRHGTVGNIKRRKAWRHV